MSLSAPKNATPSGLDQALTLIEAIRDVKKYKELLDPIKESVDKANERWKEVAIAGDIQRLRDEAEQASGAAKQTLKDAEAAAKQRLADLDREYSLKSAAVREKEQAMIVANKQRDAEMTKREKAAAAYAEALDRQAQQLAADQAALTKAHDKLKEDQKEVTKRFAAMKEAFDG